MCIWPWVLFISRLVSHLWYLPRRGSQEELFLLSYYMPRLLLAESESLLSLTKPRRAQVLAIARTSFSEAHTCQQSMVWNHALPISNQSLPVPWTYLLTLEQSLRTQLQKTHHFKENTVYSHVGSQFSPVLPSLHGRIQRACPIITHSKLFLMVCCCLWDKVELPNPCCGRREAWISPYILAVLHNTGAGTLYCI